MATFYETWKLSSWGSLSEPFTDYPGVATYCFGPWHDVHRHLCEKSRILSRRTATFYETWKLSSWGPYRNRSRTVQEWPHIVLDHGMMSIDICVKNHEF